jgi:hypothetical protein
VDKGSKEMNRLIRSHHQQHGRSQDRPRDERGRWLPLKDAEGRNLDINAEIRRAAGRGKRSYTDDAPPAA